MVGTRPGVEVMRGQGKPLPPDFRYKGQWLIEDLLFIYEPTNAQAVGGTAPRFTASDSSALGFDAGQLASLFGATVAEIFAANTDGTFQLLKIEDAVTPTGVPGKRYIFGLGERQRALIMGRDNNSGTA